MSPVTMRDLQCEVHRVSTSSIEPYGLKAPRGEGGKGEGEEGRRGRGWGERVRRGGRRRGERGGERLAGEEWRTKERREMVKEEKMGMKCRRG